VAVIGANGSGKSTLLRHLNALLLPDGGDVWIDGCNTKEPEHRQTIRSICGMVFQVPDNQIVGTAVEEDVAFGPENLGLDRGEIERRVHSALRAAGLSALRQREAHQLSAGQKQRLALAGVLAMRPACLMLDEATSALDPAGRRGVLELVRTLHRKGMTILMATHDMDEATMAQRVVVLAEGRIAVQGSPRCVFGRADHLQKMGLGLPTATALAQAIAERVPGFPPDLLRPSEVVDAVQARWRKAAS
jgi:energy-coupling factor transporter ATPase